MADAKLDVVGNWTEIKLMILKEYSNAYTQILKNQSVIRGYAYIDGFAGAGNHISKTTGEEIDGSPTIALRHDYSHYHFVDMDGDRADRLKQRFSGEKKVTVHQGDCNEILLKEIFPRYRHEEFRRALCLLDPYGLNPRWEVIYRAGQMRSIEIFLNFMIMDANMNVLWENPDQVPSSQIVRMNEFWGDESWRQAAYVEEDGLFGAMPRKRSNEDVVKAYQQRLKKIAGFQYVPDPIPMKNKNGAVIYYLFFASHNEKGDKIARHIFKKYRDGGTPHGQ